MWVKCNPNPLGKAAGDCVVRAIAIATQQSWGRIYDDLCRQSRQRTWFRISEGND